MPDHGWSGEIMHSLMCLISGAKRKPRFSQATLKKSMEGLFQQPASWAPAELLREMFRWTPVPVSRMAIRKFDNGQDADDARRSTV
jgi:hypothetical protein